MTGAATRELFLEDPYLKGFEARIAGRSGREIVLDRTAFYPGGAGVPPDKGTLGVGPFEVLVVDVKRSEEGEIVHVLDRPIPASVREVRGALDWPRRYTHMRYRTALAALRGLIRKKFGAEVSAGRIRGGRARLDFAGELPDEGVAELERLVNRKVCEGGELEGSKAGGGLYVADLGEVGRVEITSRKRRAGDTRLEITLK